MYTTTLRAFLLAMTILARTSTWLSAQGTGELSPGDRVRVQSVGLSGEFTVVAVQTDALSLRLSDGEITGVGLSDGEAINSSRADFELEDRGLIILDWDDDFSSRAIPLGQIRVDRWSPNEVRLSTDSLTSLDVRRAKAPREGGVRGLLIGLVGGAGLGYAIGHATYNECAGWFCFGPASADEQGVVGAVIGGLLAGAVGLSVGRSSPGTRWESALSSDRLNVAPADGGGVLLGYRYSF